MNMQHHVVIACGFLGLTGQRMGQRLRLCPVRKRILTWASSCLGLTGLRIYNLSEKLN